MDVPCTPRALVAAGRYLGMMDRALDDFDHPGAHREHLWDIQVRAKEGGREGDDDDDGGGAGVLPVSTAGQPLQEEARGEGGRVGEEGKSSHGSSCPAVPSLQHRPQQHRTLAASAPGCITSRTRGSAASCSPSSTPLRPRLGWQHDNRGACLHAC